MSEFVHRRVLSTVPEEREEDQTSTSFVMPSGSQQHSTATPAPQPQVSGIAGHLHHGSPFYPAQRQAMVFAATEDFLDWPPRFQDVVQPNSEDAMRLKLLLCPFLPADFDDAIQERNIAGKCGYMLCANPNRKQPLKGKYRLVIGKELVIVPKEELEKWCSDECAERALYLRVQLSEYSLGERYTRDGTGTNLKLYDEASSGEDTESQESQLHRAVEELAKGLGQLAVERGESGNRNPFDTKLLKGIIQERVTMDTTPVPPSLEQPFGSKVNTSARAGFGADMGGSGRATVEMDVDGGWSMDVPLRSKKVDHQGEEGDEDDILDSI